MTDISLLDGLSERGFKLTSKSDVYLKPSMGLFAFIVRLTSSSMLIELMHRSTKKIVCTVIHTSPSMSFSLDRRGKEPKVDLLKLLDEVIAHIETAIKPKKKDVDVYMKSAAAVEDVGKALASMSLGTSAKVLVDLPS